MDVACHGCHGSHLRRQQPVLVKYLYSKRLRTERGTTRSTGTAPDEYTGYLRGSAAWTERFLSRVGLTWIPPPSSLLKYKSTSRREAHWYRTHSSLRRPTGAIISCFDRTWLECVPCEGKSYVAFNGRIKAVKNMSNGFNV